MSEPLIVDGEDTGVDVDEIGGLAIASDRQTGEVVRVMDAAGNYINPAWLAEQYPDQYEPQQPDPMAETLERLDRIEQHVAQPRPTMPTWEQHAAVERRADEAAYATQQDIERGRGFPFTHAEMTAYYGNVQRARELGQSDDGWSAYARGVDEGRMRPSLDKRQDRVDHIVARMQDAEREQRGQQLGESDPARQQVYDWSRPADRADRHLDRMEGLVSAEDADAGTYDSSDPNEVEWGGQYPGEEFEE